MYPPFAPQFVKAQNVSRGQKKFLENWLSCPDGQPLPAVTVNRCHGSLSLLARGDAGIYMKQQKNLIRHKTYFGNWVITSRMAPLNNTFVQNEKGNTLCAEGEGRVWRH